MDNVNVDIAERLHAVELKRQKRQSSRLLLSGISLAFVLAGLFFSYRAAVEAREAQANAELAQIEARRSLEQAEVTLQGARSVEEELRGTLAALEDERNALAADVARLDSAMAENAELRNQLDQARAALSNAENTVLASARNESLQRTVYIGDGSNPAFREAAIQLPCGARVTEEAVQRSAPTGFTLVRLDRIAAIAGGRCGHSFFSATFFPDTL